jgi:cyclic pyranopterin phosphate synthase
MAPGRILSYEQMIALIDLLLPLGIRKVRVTGGEPLVRKNIVRFFELLGERPISDLTLTTNGFHLAEMAADLVRCGVRRVNVSLDSLRPETYTRITGVDGLERVVRGIDEALDRGMQVKLNTVVMKDLNLDEVADLLQFGIRRFCDVRFIELMPHAYSGPDHSSIFVPSRQVLSRLQGRFDLIQVDGGPVTGGPSTSTQYQVGGTGAAVGLISSMSEPFCAGCDKIRITPDGSVKPCLFEPGVSLRRALDEYLAGGEPGVVLDEVFRALHAKPVLHRHAGEPGTHDLVMHRTGG